MIQEVKTGKARVLFVKIPLYAYIYEMYRSDACLDGELVYQFPDDGPSGTLRLPPGKWNPLGTLSDITTDQMDKVCETFVYNNDGDEALSWCGDNNIYTDVTEAFKEVCDSVQVYAVNPYLHPKDDKMSGYSGTYDNNGFYLKALKQWQAAEERTGNWIVLIEEVQ